MANYYVEFMKKHIFAYLNPPITSKVLPMYWYLGYNVYSKSVLEVGGVILASWIVPYTKITMGWIIGALVCLEKTIPAILI